jgi:putative hydrolase of the HAD superfamily
MPPSALILDFGNVLTLDQPAEALHRMARLTGRSDDEFLTEYWRHRRAYDAGLPVAEYWRQVAGAPLSEERIGALIETDVQSWMHYREDVWNVALEFRRTGGRTAILSNGVDDIMARVRADRQLDRWFDAVVVSCEVGCSKPDPAIYRLCLDRIGVEPHTALFVDDRQVNVDAAAALGLRIVLFTGASSLADVRSALAT